MPGLSASQVTLNEVLEVRGGPMYEDELWALLYESCDAIKDLILKGNTSHMQDVLRLLNLDNIILCGSGKIRFATDVDDEMELDKRFIAPERFTTRSEEANDLALEKMFIYTIGMVIYAGAQYGNRSVAELCLSSELEMLLLYMCEDDPNCRCNLVQVFQACNSRKDIYLSVERVKSMVKSILGNDIPLDDSSFLSDKLSTSSSILKIFSPTHNYSHPLPLGSLQALKPLNSTRMNETIDIQENGDSRATRAANHSVDISRRSPLIRTYQSEDRAGSEEFYEPLRKKPEKDLNLKPVAMETRTPVKEETISRAKLDSHEAALTNLPPIKKVSSLPRDNSKAASTYSNPSFKRLISAEKRKLAKDGFLDESRNKIKFVDSRYKSMPTLNSMEQESPRSAKGSVQSAEYPQSQPKATYRKLTRFASKDSMDSASLATSQYSSAISLNYGSYTLDSQTETRRPFSYHGGSSNDGSALNGMGSFEQINEPRMGGPEFIIFPHTPELSVIDITPARLGPMPRGRRKLSVMLPTAQRLETVVESSAIAKEVFDQVTDYLSLKETMYFGLTQIKESEHVFLDLESKLTKYAPPGWKDDKKNRIDFILHFKVKFFIENVNYLRHYKTRHFFYLQLRREILCGYVFCPDEAATSLASLALQAEFSDYVEQYHGRCYFEAEHYLPGRALSRMTRSDIYHELPLLHHSYRGLREDEAEIKFLKEASRLREYGTLFYAVSRSKKDSTDSVLLGICVKGIILYEVRGQIKTEIHRQLWHMIKKFSFTRKKFVVEPKKGIGLPLLTLYTSSYKKAKYLLRMCQSFHRFSQLNQPRSLHSDSGSMVYSMKSSQGEENTDPQKENKAPNVSRNVATSSKVNTQMRSDIAMPSGKYDSSSKSTPRSDFVDNEEETEHPPQLPLKSAKTRNMQEAIARERAQPAAAEIAPENDEADNENDIEEELFEEYSPRTRRRLSTLKGVPERMTSTITLKRHPGQGLGITIVGGEDSKRLGTGIFIKNIIAGGLAAKDGRLQKGDRILSVNGNSLNQVTHDEAADVLKNATGHVKIVVSQFKSPGASFLDQSGLSMLDGADFSITPTSAKGSDSKDKTKARKIEDMKKALALSPIAVENHDMKTRHIEGVGKRGGKLARDKVVIEDEIDVEELPVEESEILMQENEMLNSTPSVGHRAEDENSAEKSDETNLDTMSVRLQKRGNSFGMSILGGIGSPFHGIYIQSIDPHGAVDEDGRMRVGDCLLQVNGVDLSQVTHKQAVKVLKNTPVQSTFLISRAWALPAEELQPFHIKPPIDTSRLSGDESSRSNSSVKETFVVTVNKGMGGLGLSLSGGAGSAPEFKGRLMVRRLFPGQPAAASGKLRIGDIIIAVNGIKVGGYTQQEAINLLRREKQTVKLLVKRPHPNDIPEELLVETPRESLDPKSVLEKIQRRISEEDRQMPEQPYSDADHVSMDSDHQARQSTDGDEIIPYPKNIVTLEAKPTLQENASPKHISIHEVLVHAQISGPRQRKVHSEAGNFSQKVIETCQDNTISLPDLAKLPDTVAKTHLDKPIVKEEVDLSEQQLSLPELDELIGSSEEQLSTNELIVPDNVTMDQSSLDLSLPDLPSAEEMSGLKLPDLKPPVLENGHIDSPQVQLQDEQSETSPITDPGFSSDEEGLQFKSDILKEDGAEIDGIKAGPVTSKLGESSSIAKETLIQPPIKDSSKSLEPKFMYFEVSLKKGATGLGFTLAGGKSTTGGCFIQDIVSDPAKSCGKLQSGDQIVMVDSFDISEYEHMDAVEVLRGTKSLVKLGIKRDCKDEKTEKKSLGYEMITLNRSSRGRFGLILGEENGEIIVEDTIVDEPAEFDGNLRYGDIIKEMNDIPLEGMSLNDANVILEDAMPILQLAVQRKKQNVRESRYAVGGDASKLSGERRKMPGNGTKPQLEGGNKSTFPFARSDSWRSDSTVSSSPKKSSITNSPVLKRLEVVQDGGQSLRMRKSSSQEDKGEVVIVQLEKSSSGLGMSLTGHNDFGDKSGAFIANINPEGVAAKTGRLRTGDKVVSINGQNVERNQQKEVVDILRKTNGRITLEVFRHPAKLFSSVDRGSSIVSSDPSDDNDLDEMDFHFTEELHPTDQALLSDKLLSLLPGSNDHVPGENSVQEKIIPDADHQIKDQIEDQIEDSGDNDDLFHLQLDDGMIKDNLNLDQPAGDFLDHNNTGPGAVDKNADLAGNRAALHLDLDDGKITRNLDDRNRGSEYGLTHDLQDNENRNLPTAESSSHGFEDSRKDQGVTHNVQDLSWNDSEISDEEDQAKPLKGDKNQEETIIKKSSMSTSFVGKKQTIEKASGNGTIQETSFSSTLEKVTPSSSIVSSILDEISPVNSSDEESDFDFSSSLIPDLSSFTIEDKEAFEKYYGQKDESKAHNNEGDNMGESLEDATIDTETADDKRPTKNSNIAESVKKDDESVIIESNDLHSSNGGMSLKNLQSIGVNGESKARLNSSNFSDSSWKEDNDASFSGKEDDNEESFSQGLQQSLEADSLDVLMALEEYDVRNKNEFNDTLKDQLAKESLNVETSFTVEKEREKANADGENSKSLNMEHDLAKTSSDVEKKSHMDSRIPKLDTKKLNQHSQSPLRRSPGKSGIPIFSPPRSPSKSKNNIELSERSSKAEVDEVSHAETTFMDESKPIRGKDKDFVGIEGFEMKVDLDAESDDSFETDDDLALSLTRDTFSFGQEELNAKITHFQAILDSENIDREFQDVKDIKPKDSCDVARRSANRDKNRFRSILPFDKTRVCLAGGEEKDYINANHVKFQAGGMAFHYIAAQGPLSNTVDDFWRMIWEQRIETIIMITKDVEGGKVKCHRYWPDLPGLPLKASDRFRIELMHRKESGNQIERQFSLLNTKLNKSVTINHLLYNAWPETGIPKEPLPFLMFVKNSTEMHTTGPLLVHCSAGTGRTGLFIATDILNKVLPTEANIDILDLVKSLKHQRQSLIQTKDQYVFCYKMAVEVLQEEKHLTY